MVYLRILRWIGSRRRILGEQFACAPSKLTQSGKRDRRCRGCQEASQHSSPLHEFILHIPSFCRYFYVAAEGSVAGVELLHDVPDMHLDGAFAHAQLVSDYLVLLALPQPLQHLGLTRRKLDW